MKLNEILEKEKSRESQETWNKIYVSKEGTFFRVYEWSAWLLKNFVCTEKMQTQRGDEKILSAKCYQTKNNSTYVMCGFPLESLSKYIPSYKDKSVLKDGSILIEVDTSLEDVSYEILKADFEQWKAMCPIKEKTKMQKAVSGSSNLSAISQSGLFSIVSIILSYPVENTTPAQNLEFISNLKQRAATML